MTSDPTQPRGPIHRPIYVVVMAIAFLALVAASLYAYNTARYLPHTRPYVLAATIITGSAAALCIAGAMRFINARIEQIQSVRFFERWPLVILQRLLMIIQLAAMLIAAASAAGLLFGSRIPGT